MHVAFRECMTEMRQRAHDSSAVHRASSPSRKLRPARSNSSENTSFRIWPSRSLRLVHAACGVSTSTHSDGHVGCAGRAPCAASTQSTSSTARAVDTEPCNRPVAPPKPILASDAVAAAVVLAVAAAVAAPAAHPPLSGTAAPSGLEDAAADPITDGAMAAAAGEAAGIAAIVGVGGGSGCGGDGGGSGLAALLLPPPFAIPSEALLFTRPTLATGWWLASPYACNASSGWLRFADGFISSISDSRAANEAQHTRMTYDGHFDE